MHIIGFDLGLASTAYAVIEVAPTPRLFNSGSLVTWPEDSLQERAEELCAAIGEVLWKWKGLPMDLAAEEPPMGSTQQRWLNKSVGPLQIVRGILTAAAVYAGRSCTFYAPRSWHSRIGIGKPPATVKAGDRREWLKEQVSCVIMGRVVGAEKLSNEHQRDAAGVAYAHLLRPIGG